MGPINISIGHDDDLAVTQFADIEVVGADPAVQSLDDGSDLFEAENLVEAGTRNIEDLALEREDGLSAVITTALGGTTGRITLDQINLGFIDVLGGAVVELARQATCVERTLAAGEFTSFSGCLAGRLPPNNCGTYAL